MKLKLESELNNMTVEDVLQRVPYIQEIDRAGIASLIVENGKIYVEV